LRVTRRKFTVDSEKNAAVLVILAELAEAFGETNAISAIVTDPDCTPLMASAYCGDGEVT
jgi:hypothetical protein